MPERFRRWLKGYLYIRLNGYGPERFFNLCKGGGLSCWNVRQERDGYYCHMVLEDFYKIRPYLRKSRMSMRIVSRKGLPFVLQRNRKRKALAVAVLSFFAALYVMSLFVWNISFEGNRQYSRETLLDYLAEEDIRYGMRKSLVDCDKLEEGIRSRFPEITWVSARVSGTRLLVKLKENEVLSTIPQQKNFPCELVASEDGVITRMVIRQGKASVSVGDEVEKGQQLISGQLSILNDGGEVVRTAYVHADGEIYARISRHYQKEFPQFYRVMAKTGRKRPGIRIVSGSYSVGLLMPDFEKSTWSYVTSVSQICLFEDFYLPVFVEKIKGEAYVSYERSYTQEEKNQEAVKLQENYMKNLMEKGVQIIENNVKIQEYDHSWVIEGTVVVEEEISQQHDITEIEETREADERN